MSKVRTKSGWAKRIKVRKGGTISRRKAGKRHLMISKSKKRKRRLRRPALVSRADMRRIRGF
jgi:large subunit ribosomal protein L35